MSNSILNSSGLLAFSSLNDYQKVLVEDVSDTVTYYALGDERKALSIRYLKQQESNNSDRETGVMHKQLNSTFYAYHFTPVLENQPSSPLLQFDDSKQGLNSTTSGEITILSLSRPTNGDLFNFYIKAHQDFSKDIEVFKITDVTFLRTSAGLNLYRLNYETAQIKEEVIYITKSFFYYNDFKKFYPIKYITYLEALNKKEYMLTIKKYYKSEWCIIYDPTLSKELNVKLNKVLLFLKYKDPTNSTQLPPILIRDFYPEKIIDPSYPISDGGLEFVREDVWFENPNYIPDPTKEWNWLNDKIPNELALCVWTIYLLYRPFYYSLESGTDVADDTNPDLFFHIGMDTQNLVHKAHDVLKNNQMQLFEKYTNGGL